MKIKGVEVNEKTKLIGQSGDLFLFLLPTPRDENGEVILGGMGYPLQPVFIYEIRHGVEKRSALHALGSLATCMIAWGAPEKNFTQEEIERIRALPGPTKPGSSEPYNPAGVDDAGVPIKGFFDLND